MDIKDGMTTGEYESAINCPLCGKEAVLALEPCNMPGVALLDALLGKDSRQNHYSAEAKCPSCGALIMASLTVTASKA
jgi:predicted RNA-binding Zn-ribbon protein involved in translation (DUF1610 family)